MQEYPELPRIVNAFFRRGVMPETYVTEKTTKTEDKKNNHPLKNKPFYGIPRHIALMPGVTDRIFRLISILCSAFGDDGHIEFKIKTLSIVMGSKSDKAMRRIIKEAEELELIETIQTGRSLKFTLSDKFYSNGPVDIKAKNDRSGAVKNVRTDRSKMTAPYHLEKKALKTTANAAAVSKKPKKPDKVIMALKNRIDKQDLQNNFNQSTYEALKSKGLMDGQIITLIAMLNSSRARSCGWMISMVDKLGLDNIKDYNVSGMKAKSYNSNDEYRKNEGKIIIYNGKEYTIGESGELVMDIGTFNKFQVDRMIKKGKINVRL